MANILSDVREGIGYLTVNRPNVLNALNGETIVALKDAFREFQIDDEVRVVILTGTGEKAFIAGADIKEMKSHSPSKAIASARRGQDLTNLIENFPKVVIAAVNGYALGGGCEVAMACHIRVASNNAMFGQPEVNLGIIPGWGGTQRLPRLVGKGRAIEMITSGEMISALVAKEIGLINHVTEPGSLMDKSEEISKSIIKRGPEAVRLSLEAVNKGLEMTQELGLEYEANLFGIVFSTEDHAEGSAAFVEKRNPNFKGK